MDDIEKVIKGLDICLKNIESQDCPSNCPYFSDCSKYENRVVFQPLMRDAIAMLKEQDAKTHGADSGMCEICSFYERALPVKPHYNARTNWYECGACYYSMTSGMHCRGELIPAYNAGFCAKCGRSVKWE